MSNDSALFEDDFDMEFEDDFDSALATVLEDDAEEAEAPEAVNLDAPMKDLEEFDRSFAQLHSASVLRRGHMHHDPEADLAAMDAIRRVYDASYLGGSAGYDSREPIFIVGLPRTGTTLVERILGSHSAVFAAGELNNFAECLGAQVAPLKPADRMDFIAKAAQVDILTNLSRQLLPGGFLFASATEQIEGISPTIKPSRDMRGAFERDTAHRSTVAA